MKRMGIFVTATCVALGLVGCGGTTPPEQPPEDLGTDSVLVEKQLQQYSDGVLAMFPDAELPEVKVVRLVTPEEWPEIVAQCVTESGFSAKATKDGGISIDVENPAQEEAMWIANYVCKAQFPINPKYQQPLDEAQAKRLYRYFVKELTSCVESFGVLVDEAPTETVFLQNMETEQGWHPYEHVEDLGDSKTQDLLESCPQQPPASFR